MSDTPARLGPDDVTAEIQPVSPATVAATDTESVPEESAAPVDTSRTIRTWVWMILVSGFGLFLVFGSVNAHFWDENAAGTYYVPVTRGMQVLDIWQAQVNGLPEVAHQTVLKSVFLVSIFAFLGLSVIALWLATVEIFQAPPAERTDGTSDGREDDSSRKSATASIASAG